MPSRIGRYDVEGTLGEGAAGRVLLARDSALGRRVALKILREDLPPELRAEAAEQARREARAAALVAHPGIVALLDFGEDPALGPFLVFELADGPTLAQRLAERGPLPPVEVAALARTLSSALTYAHGAGVVHGDVKPANVLLTRTGPKLSDFGTARADAAGGRAHAGSPAYASPESLSSGATAPAGDQFSLAVTLYEALTGARPFGSDTDDALRARVLGAKHPAASARSPALRAFANLDAILDRALSKEPRNRFASCEAFGALLARELEGANAVVTTPLPRSSLVPRATRRWQNVAALLGAAVITTLVVAGRGRTEGAGVSMRDVASEFATAAAAAPRAAPVGLAPARPAPRDAGADAPP